MELNIELDREVRQRSAKKVTSKHLLTNRAIQSLREPAYKFVHIRCFVNVFLLLYYLQPAGVQLYYLQYVSKYSRFFSSVLASLSMGGLSLCRASAMG